MNEVIEVHVKFGEKTHLVGHLRYFGKARRQSSLFEYTDSWLSYREAFALDPANLQLAARQHYWTSKKTALPGAIDYSYENNHLFLFKTITDSY